MKIAERIRLAIEEAVQNGELLPGDTVDEQQLMQSYEVSRTPVREALLQLQAQGLVKSMPRGGMVVAKMDTTQLLAMWELLAELEGVCARLACERMTPEERAELAKVHERAGATVRKNDLQGWQEHNRRFHELLYQGARNPYLRQEILRVRSQTGAYRRHAFAAVGLLRASWEQHGELLQAIEQRDTQAVARCMVRHMSPGQGTTSFAAFMAALPKDLMD